MKNKIYDIIIAWVRNAMLKYSQVNGFSFNIKKNIELTNFKVNCFFKAKNKTI